MREVFVCPELCRGEEARRLLEILPGSGAERLDVSEAVFARLAFGQRAEGMVAVAAVPAARLEDLVLPASPLVAVLEGVEKPGNVGAVLRSADGAGVSALVVADPRTDLFNPNAIRASLGTVFSLPVAAAAPGDVLAWLRGRGLQILAARVEGSVAYTEVDYRLPTAIILGSEAAGLTAVWSGDDVRADSLADARRGRQPERLRRRRRVVLRSLAAAEVGQARPRPWVHGARHGAQHRLVFQAWAPCGLSI